VSAEITQWVDPFGVITTLDIDWDATGRFMPTVAHEEDGIPGEPGAIHRASRHAIREFTIKHLVTAADEPSLRQAVRALVKAMNPARDDDPSAGPGAIRVTAPDSVVREIPCYYSAGLEMQEQEEMSGPQMQAAAITFRSYEPYWRDVSDTVAGPFTVGVTPTFFPIFPVRLTSSQIAVDTTVDNDGDVNCWPVWTITGTGAVITLRNLTTGLATVFTTTALGLGESITIDTRPTQKSVTKQDGTNLFWDLDISSELWPLIPGSNEIRLEMASVTSGVSALQGNYRQRYLTP
jgi:phage-related protein